MVSPRLLSALMCIVTLYGCNQQNGRAPQTPEQQLSLQDQQEQTTDNEQSEQLLEFNNTDTSIATNGNVAVAVQRLESLSPSELWQNSSVTSPSKLIKNPHALMGHLVKLTGSVYNIAESSPTKIPTGHWTEMLMVVGNINSPIGATSVDFTYKGDVRGVHSGATIICAGYFIGTYRSKSAQDSTIECLSVVGNVFKNQY